MTRDEFVECWRRVAALPNSEVMYMGREAYAAVQVMVEFRGRDRRRIKREVNKAMRKARWQ